LGVELEVKKRSSTMEFAMSFVIAVIGALIYAFAANKKAEELGRIIFFCGMLWFVYGVSHSRFGFGR
jgi:Na+/phosphate symporter